MITTIRSYLTGLKASSAFGEAVRLNKRGEKAAALDAARSGLLVLRKPYVNRVAAAEGAVLTSLTVLVE